MTRYRCEWAIDVNAETPEAAALEALRMVQVPTSAVVFDVFDEDAEQAYTRVDFQHVETLDAGLTCAWNTFGKNDQSDCGGAIRLVSARKVDEPEAWRLLGACDVHDDCLRNGIPVWLSQAMGGL